MQVKSRTDIFSDILRDAKKCSTEWNAVFGTDTKRLSSDCYLFHQKKGLYLLKEFQKNPYQRIGVGGKIARHVDEELLNSAASFSTGFGIITGDIYTILSNINAGLHPEDIINAAFQGKNLGVQFPVKGQATTSSDTYTSLKQQETQKQKKINTLFEKKAHAQGLYTGFD